MKRPRLLVAARPFAAPPALRRGAFRASRAAWRPAYPFAGGLSVIKIFAAVINPPPTTRCNVACSFA